MVNPLRVLVVDDDPGMREGMALSLKRAGFVTEQARSGEDALRMTRPGAFDAVVTDLRMTGMDGLQLTARLKALLEPEFRAGPADDPYADILRLLPPGYADWDFSAFKTIPVAEGKEFQFRAEFFNLLNHTNFRLPDSDISSPTFNQILAAQPPRLIQFALKFQF